MTKSRKLTFILAFFLMFLESCDSSIEFIDFTTLEESVWQPKDTLSFSFRIADTIQPKDLFLHVRNNSNYEFSNLYIITQMKFPSNQMIIDTLQYEMADQNGRFLGEGLSSVKESKLYYKEKKIFPKKGDYVLKVYQAMRKQGALEAISLKGIKEIGFSVENLN